ncbi:late competence development ComFB family protein [Gynuella sunshinyii]|uniref:Late competence development protein ComFB n=1 Tax=Gynuella sunshinyii YC6258 TaxID=1445510 RepID=A0A0C5VBY3_9GAMM|nr:late competence development ComFB family protein [Gynuella sunshinyii]AJQ96855.1 hypothetical Protein YC6258_04823 [Gynuella sunshinyii YC6258]
MTIEADIKNFYENLVVEELYQKNQQQLFETSELEDIACVALNHLPPRYYRHSVDMAFYLSRQELGEMRKKVEEAVEIGIKVVSEKKR